MELGEEKRNPLCHKAWIRLINWPIHCWSEAEVTAAVSGFRELWEIDDLSLGMEDVSAFRVLVRCRDVNCIPEVLNLTVVDRCFRIPIVIESWEAAEPIVLGEEHDQRLGLTTVEAQNAFINLTGFSSVPAAATKITAPTHQVRRGGFGPPGAQERGSEQPDQLRHRQRHRRSVSRSNSNSIPSVRPMILPSTEAVVHLSDRTCSKGAGPSSGGLLGCPPRCLPVPLAASGKEPILALAASSFPPLVPACPALVPAVVEGLHVSSSSQFGDEDRIPPLFLDLASKRLSQDLEVSGSTQPLTSR